MKRTLFLIVFALILVVIVTVVSLAITKDSDKRNKLVEPLVTTAMSIAAPVDARPQGDVSRSSDPPTAVRVWQSDGAIDDVCAKWREAYRVWIGPENVGAVTGDVFPGQSCTFEGRKDGHPTELIVAVYSDGKPTASLNVTQ